MTGALTERKAKRISPNKASWGAGPQQREFREEIQQAKQVGVRGPNKKAFKKKGYKQSRLGYLKLSPYQVSQQYKEAQR
ncbi:nitrogen regulation protein NIFR3 [Staphylococcus lugdunensis]|uniref:Uncharacterized protein n=1 Tax=Staphylococcus lugdunensis TaxID=28035 RepID=A0ABD4EE69_STALU|nr:hypothetical protein HMPREF0790_0404 [Staphylococcus lugdunensis M23590]KXA37282.1 hypothetical protein HMPREF3225_01763 [Staphylococcus lugdunensis]SQE71822.1 nitrogen regulation protein NIFR3 [Staphylococcus lugdunensis]